jgi:multicomponent Na+:H+ antiporter subunit B
MKGMTLIVRTVTRWVKVFIFLYGVYIILTGHLSPGGGFAGGVIIACSYMLLTLAYGKEFSFSRLKPGVAHHLDSIGAAIFLAVALIALGFGGILFSNFLIEKYATGQYELLGSGTILISNIAVGLKVAASLFLVFAILAVLRIVTAGDGTFTMIQEEEEE